MRLSLFSVLDGDPGALAAGRDRFGEFLELAERADAVGLEAAWIAEHHFQPGGLCPSPPVLLAAMAARTRRVRLGAMVSVVPFHSPVDLAEQYALVDRLSRGRLNLGLGSGYIGDELAAFGVDSGSKRERFDVGFDTIVRALSGEPVAVVPGSTPAVRLNVRPVQTPHPPLWVAVQRREAIPFVARRGANIGLIPYATLDSIDGLAPLVAEYRATLPPGRSGTVSAACHVYLGPSRAGGRAALQRYLDSRRATQSTFYLQQVARDARHASLEHLEQVGLVAVGDDREVSERLAGFRAAGVDELLAIVDFGGLPLSEALATVEGLARIGPALSGVG